MMFCAFITKANAQTSVTAKDTIQFDATNVVMEDDPNAGSYCFTLYSPDGQWKAQILYKSADGMYGTYHTEDFNLKGEGRYYNYVRNPKNDMVFYNFSEMEVSVADNTTETTIVANCLTSSGTRYLMTGHVPTIVPSVTVSSDMGYARFVRNDFFGTYVITAENDDFSLAYGIIAGHMDGTFYRADLLKPELFDKASGDSINVINATAVHVVNGERTDLALDIIGQSTDAQGHDVYTLYRLQMFNEPYEVTVTEEVNIDFRYNAVLQDLTQMYGCYQFAAANDDYAIALAVSPDAFKKGTLDDGKRTCNWTMDDIVIPYTNIVRLADETFEVIHDVKATAVAMEHIVTLSADITCADGTLYHVVMRVIDDEYAPEPVNTVEINFGKAVVVDYTRGLGTIGVGAAITGKYQLRLTLRATELEGEFHNEDIVNELTDIMIVKGNTYSFHDAWKTDVKALKLPNGRTALDVNMLATDTVLYHAVLYIEPLKSMEDTDINLNYQEGVDMVALQQGADGDYAEYNLQFQQLPADYNPMLPIKNGQVYSFYFAHRGPGIEGEYSYSDGTLADDEYHTFYEDGTEIRVAPVAGTLSIKAEQPVMLTIGDVRYGTYIYKVEYHFVGQNGAVYTGQGDNYLICIDEEGDLTEVDESDNLIDAISTAYAEHGYDVRKMLRDGKLVINTPRGSYNAQGARLTH